MGFFLFDIKKFDVYSKNSHVNTEYLMETFPSEI